MSVSASLGSQDSMYLDGGFWEEGGRYPDVPANFDGEMEREYAVAATYGFAPVLTAALGFWGLIGFAINIGLHH